MRISIFRQKVKNIEGFDVVIAKKNGRKIRRFRHDKNINNNFNFKRAASSSTTVAQWIQRRMCIPNLPNNTIVVLDGDGFPVHGRTTLANVRNTYEN